MITPVPALPIDTPASAAPIPTEAAKTIAALFLASAERNEQDAPEYQGPAIIGGTEGHTDGM
jgi:hypothetical protein